MEDAQVKLILETVKYIVDTAKRKLKKTLLALTFSICVDQGVFLYVDRQFSIGRIWDRRTSDIYNMGYISCFFAKEKLFQLCLFL